MKKKKLIKEELVDLHGVDYVKKIEGNREIYKKRLNNILTSISLSKSYSVVDYGCGNGQLFEMIHDKISRYCGLDFSASFIQAFQRRLDSQTYTKNYFF